MQPIDTVWIIGMIGVFYFLFIKKDKSNNPKNKKT